MKRDIDLIRDILLYVEDQPAGISIRQIAAPEKYSPAEVTEHLRFLLTTISFSAR